MSNLELINIFENRFDNLDSKLLRLEDKIDNLVSDEDCQEHQKNCNNNMALRQGELSIKKITAVGSVVAGILTATAAAVAVIIKIFFPI